MTRILAIDPGSVLSAWMVIDQGLPFRDHAGDAFGKIPNPELQGMLRACRGRVAGASVVVIEWTAPRGMPASAELFETMWWAGRFAEACYPLEADRLARASIKRHLCGTTASNDTNVRAALIDRFGGAGGKDAAIGLKAAPGPLYGVKADIWAALAVAVSWLDGAR
jgi:hypothetical protein